jgi:hypothetical protein
MVLWNSLEEATYPAMEVRCKASRVIDFGLEMLNCSIVRTHGIERCCSNPQTLTRSAVRARTRLGREGTHGMTQVPKDPNHRFLANDESRKKIYIMADDK